MQSKLFVRIQYRDSNTFKYVWAAGLRSLRFLVGVGFLTTLGVGVGFFCPTPAYLVRSFFTSHSWIRNSCGNGTISFETFVETEISCSVPRFPLISTVKFHSLYVKESESGVENFGKVRVGYFTSDSATLLSRLKYQAQLRCIKATNPSSTGQGAFTAAEETKKIKTLPFLNPTNLHCQVASAQGQPVVAESHVEAQGLVEVPMQLLVELDQQLARFFDHVMDEPAMLGVT